MANNAASSTTIDSMMDFTNDPKGWASRWSIEMASAEKETKNWWTSADKVVKRFLDIRGPNTQNDSRLNIFTSNIQTLRAILYGRTPKVDVHRRFDDFNDQVARVAGEMMERLLNTDIEDDEDGYSTAIGHALDDRTLVGLGQVKLRYEASFRETEGQKAILDPNGNELAPEVPGEEEVAEQDIDFDYYYWKDQLWSPARTFGGVRWWAFKNYMTKEQVAARFGKKIAARIPYGAKKPTSEKGEGVGQDVQRANPWQRAEVWEIWSKEDKAVYWWVKGYGETLDRQDDPYQLEGFWPFPAPLMANLTTSAFMPRPEFIIAQDLYNEIDYISTRITLIERAVKVVGCYDASSDGVRRLLTEGFDNDLIPVANWAMFAEKGGLNGQISWLPLADIITALDKLREYRMELIKLVYEVTGMSDIMRGASESRETATAQAIKAKFGSVRMQSMQDEFARFCTDLLKLKAELILKLYDDQTIMQQANVQFFTQPDQMVAPQALQMLRTQGVRFRLEVKPENVSLTDYAALRQERTEFLTALSSLASTLAPLAQQLPGSVPLTLEMLKWVMAAFKGGSTIEGVLDQAIQQATQALQQPPPPPPPPPQVQAQEARAKADIAVSQAKAQAEIQTAQTKAAIDVQAKQAQSQMELQKNAMKSVQDLQAMMMKWRQDTIQKTGFDPQTGQMVGGGPAHLSGPVVGPGSI